VRRGSGRLTPARETQAARNHARRHRAVAAALLCLLSATFARTLAAQSLAVHLVEDATGRDVAGAIIALLSTDGRTIVAEGISGSSGRRVLATPGGSYRMLVRRVGFEPYSRSVVVADSGLTELLLPIPAKRVRLPTVAIRGERRCGRISDGGARSVALWEEIRKTLDATRISNADSVSLEGFTFRRELAPSGVIRKHEVTPVRIANTRPFVARSPRDLSRRGYIDSPGASWAVYHGPDEIVLLSHEFLVEHCFDVVDGDSIPGASGLAGLSFEPARGRRRPDIAGVLWVDTVTLALRDLEFSYTRARLALNPMEAAGKITFALLPSGHWGVSAWVLRLPTLREGPAPIFGSRKRTDVLGYVEMGGALGSYLPAAPPPTNPPNISPRDSAATPP
jgi:hypothetical protein